MKQPLPCKADDLFYITILKPGDPGTNRSLPQKASPRSVLNFNFDDKMYVDIKNFVSKIAILPTLTVRISFDARPGWL
jgi:hypothetical protein